MNQARVLLLLSLCFTLPVAADELADLKTQVEILAKKIEQLEQQRKQADTAKTEAVVVAPSTEATKTPVIPTTNREVVTAGDFPGSFRIPDTNTSIRIHGFAQVNLIHDLMGRPTSRGGDSAGIATAPLEGSPEYEMRGDSRIGARDSRLGISTSTPTDYGPVKTLIEGDFNGAPNDKASRATTSRTAFTIRHAYGEFGGFLFGQAYTNYMDISAFTEKLDGAGPIGRTFMRQGQIRYTYKFDDNSRFAVALENPRGDFVEANDDTLDDSVPDLTANYRYQTRRWHTQFSGMLRRMGVDDGGENGEFNGVNDNAIGWALQNSTAFYLGDSMDRISWYLQFGDGMGRYVESGADQGASITKDGKLDTQFTYGGFVSYRHWWTDTIRSNIDFGMMRHDLNPLDEAMFPSLERSRTRNVYSSHSNIIWSPVEQVSLGIEYVWGNREAHDGREGKVRRLLFTSIYDF